MGLLIFSASLAVFFALQAVYWIAVHRRASRESALADRLGMTELEEGRSGELLRHAEQDESWLTSLASVGKLRVLLEAAGDDPNVTPFVTRMLVFFLVVFAGGLLLTESLAGGLFAGLLGAYLPIVLLRRKLNKRINTCEEQLPEALELMIISLRAGHSLQQAVRLSAGELQAPIGEEFRRVAEEIELGRPIDEALVSMSERLRTARTVRTFVVSVLVLRQTGGNLIEVLESIIDSMRQQTQYQRKLRAMTSEGTSSSRMLAAIPPLFAALSWASDPTYITRLTGDPFGQVILIVATSLYVGGMLWVRRLVAPRT